MTGQDQVPVRLVLTLGLEDGGDVHRLAGEILGFLTSRPQVKRVEPTRIQEQIEAPDGGLEWRDIEYWRQGASLHGATEG